MHDLLPASPDLEAKAFFFPPGETPTPSDPVNEIAMQETFWVVELHRR